MNFGIARIKIMVLIDIRNAKVIRGFSRNPAVGPRLADVG
jgi:hypothetical protein